MPNGQNIRVFYCILDNRFGGPHRRAEATARWLSQHGIETVFLLGHKSGPAWQPDAFETFTLRHLQCFKRQRSLLSLLQFCGRLPYNLWRIRRLIKAHDISIIHVDGVTNFVPALAARLTGTPLVWLYNDHLPGPLKRLLLPPATALATVVVVQSETLKESRTAGNRKLHAKTTVLPAGVDTDHFDPDRYAPEKRDQLKRELGIEPDCPVVGIVGNLNRFKGHAWFLQAAGKIKEAVGRVRFLVVGRKLDTDPGYWEQLQQLTAEQGLKDDVVFTDFREDVAALLSVMDVFVLASIRESCPLVVLEAMAMKVPVVATSVGAVPELIADGRTGFVVPPKDANGIAQAVLICLRMSEEDRQTLTQAARRNIEADFDIRHLAAQQKRLYEGLPSGRACS